MAYQSIFLKESIVFSLNQALCSVDSVGSSLVFILDVIKQLTIFLLLTWVSWGGNVEWNMEYFNHSLGVFVYELQFWKEFFQLLKKIYPITEMYVSIVTLI